MGHPAHCRYQTRSIRFGVSVRPYNGGAASRPVGGTPYTAARHGGCKAVPYGGQDFSPAPAVAIMVQPVAGLKPRPPYGVHVAAPARGLKPGPSNGSRPA